MENWSLLPNIKEDDGVGRDDRSTATRNKLLAATYQILCDRGHIGVRTASVSQVSGVSRGGLLHHFPSMELLVAAVYERLSLSLDKASWRNIDAASDDRLPEAIVEDATARFFHEAHKVMLDILVSAGQDEALIETRKSLAARNRLSPVVGWTGRLVATGVDQESARQVASMLYDMVNGLAIYNTVRPDKAHTNQVIAIGLMLARRACERARASASRPRSSSR